MSTKPENENFAESAKKVTEKYVGEYFDSPALDQAAQKIVQSAMEKPPVQDTPVKPALAESLRLVQKQELYLGERDEDGKSIIPTFERFLKKLRRVFVSNSDGHIGDAYKLVTEAVLFIKLQDCGASPLPVSRAQLQKLDQVDAEGQLAVWNQAVTAFGGADITAAEIAKTAHALGYDDVTLPAPSASSVLNNLRTAWGEFKALAEKEFGSDMVKLFTPMDNLLAPKRPKKDPLPHSNVAAAVPQKVEQDNGSASKISETTPPRVRLVSPSKPAEALPMDLPAVSKQGSLVTVRFASVQQGGDYFRAGLYLYKYGLEDKTATGLWVRQADSEQQAHEIAANVSEALRSAKLKVSGNLRDDCEQAGTAFFMKQLGRKPSLGSAAINLVDKHGGDWAEWPEDLRVRQLPLAWRIGAAAARHQHQLNLC